jgi:SAM-dependent methyltransferase
MDLHTRYIQQAAWTSDLRNYVFTQAGLSNAQRVLEVGCGTGALLSSLQTPAALFGLDIDPAALAQARNHAASADLIRGDAHRLSIPAASLDIVFCHFLLLWVSDPLAALREMKRVTRPGGYVLALAEPDYTARVDQPASLAVIGRLQAESLHRRGADVGLGARLAELFDRAGMAITETGAIEPRSVRAVTPAERELEWAVLEADLAGLVPEAEIRRLKELDEEAWTRGEREFSVPTYFAWGTV